MKIRYTKEEVDEIVKQSERKMTNHLNANFCSLTLFDEENKLKSESIDSLSQSTNTYQELLKELSNKFQLINTRINEKVEKQYNSRFLLEI